MKRMVEKEVKVENRAGVHMRPASLITQTCGKFKSEVFIVNKDAKVNARSVIGVMSMGALYGTNLTLQASGEDEREVLDALENLFKTKFEED